MTWVLRHPQKSQGPDRHWGHDISNFGAHYGELTEIVICECLYCDNIALVAFVLWFSESCFAEWEEKLLTSWGCFCVNQHMIYIHIYCGLVLKKEKSSLNSFFSNFQQGFLAPFCPYYTISAAKKSGTVQLLCHTVQSSQNTDIAMHCLNFLPLPQYSNFWEHHKVWCWPYSSFDSIFRLCKYIEWIGPYSILSCPTW